MRVSLQGAGGRGHGSQDRARRRPGGRAQALRPSRCCAWPASARSRISCRSRARTAIIAAAGLSALASARAPGLRALLLEAGVEEGCAPDLRGDRLPGRSAAERGGPARYGRDRAVAPRGARSRRGPREAARELSARNVERQAIERRVTREARERIARTFDPGADVLLLEWDAGWHRGVLGIAASRLAREFHRPVLLFGFDGDRALGLRAQHPGRVAPRHAPRRSRPSSTSSAATTRPSGAACLPPCCRKCAMRRERSLLRACQPRF